MQITLHMHSLAHIGPGFADLIQRRTSYQHHCHATSWTLRAGSINTHRSIVQNTPRLKTLHKQQKRRKTKILTRYNVVSFRWLLLIAYLSTHIIIYRTMCFTLHQYFVIFKLIDCRNHTACYCYKLPST